MESFEQVATLETAALRELFAHGRPEERVWAIWALALRTGGIVAVDGATKDPDAGVRRTMAVMLASHGETDMLVELARRDPQSTVRESAMQIVTRLAAQGALDARVVLDAAAADPAVRGAIFAAIDRDAPVFLVDLASQYLRSGTSTEQADAFEALLRTQSREIARAALAWLEALPDELARDACARMVRVAGEYAVACELARAPRRLRVIALGILHAPKWPAVEQLIGDDAELLMMVVRENRIDVPITAIARAALDGHAAPLVERLSRDLELIDAPSAELRPLLFLLDSHYAQWIKALEADDDAQPALPASTNDDDEYVLARKDARKHLVKLRKQLQRLMRR